MTDFGTLVSSVLEEVDTENERTEANIRRSVHRALSKVRTWRTGLMERSVQFTTVADQGTYGASDTDFPKDILEIHSISPDSTSETLLAVPMPRASIERVRSLQASAANARVDFEWAWYGDKLWLGPTPSSAVAINIDYDGSPLWSTDGNTQFTSANAQSTSIDGATNAWFVEGEFALRALILADYYRFTTKDMEALALAKEEIREARQYLEQEWFRKHPSAVAESTW